MLWMRTRTIAKLGHQRQVQVKARHGEVDEKSSVAIWWDRKGQVLSSFWATVVVVALSMNTRNQTSNIY